MTADDGKGQNEPTAGSFPSRSGFAGKVSRAVEKDAAAAGNDDDIDDDICRTTADNRLFGVLDTRGCVCAMSRRLRGSILRSPTEFLKGLLQISNQLLLYRIWTSQTYQRSRLGLRGDLNA